MVTIPEAAAAAAAKSLQSCLTVQPHRWQPTRLPCPGILQARTLGWVAISFSNAWKWKVKVKSLSRVWLLAAPWTVVHQAPPSMGFSRQEYWSGVPLPSPCTVAGNIRTDFCACLHEPVGWNILKGKIIFLFIILSFHVNSLRQFFFFFFFLLYFTLQYCIGLTIPHYVLGMSLELEIKWWRQ